MTWNQIESKLAIAATLFIALVFLGAVLVFIADEYDDTPRYLTRRQGTAIEGNRAPNALKPQSNELASQINQSSVHAAAPNTQLARSQKQGLGIYDNNTTATNRESDETSQFDTPAAQMAAFPATPLGHAIEEEKRQVLQSIETWRTAWQAQDVDAYTAHYTDTFLPANGHSHEAWLQDRRIKLTRARSISVQIDHLQVQRLDDQRWKATFHQRYQSNTYADKVTKELLMIKMGDQYLIEKERAW